MYCKHCGQEINDNAAVCIHCGCAVSNAPAQTQHSAATKGESKTGLGILLGLLLGFIGLIIGICMYPSGSVERKTFTKACGITIAISVGVSVLIFIITIAAGAAFLY